MYPVVDTSDVMEETQPKVHVAVGKDLKQSLSTLRWALHNSGGAQICILHVHQPAEKIPFMGAKVRISQLAEHHVKAHHEMERQDMLQLLDKYNQICQITGVSADVNHLEMRCIEKGIVDFILEHNVRRLVMGAAADKHYSRKMVDLRSSKAIYVRSHAAASCQIQFVCKGNIIFTRFDGPGVSIPPPSLASSDTNSESGQSSMRSSSVSDMKCMHLQPKDPTQDYRRVVFEECGTRMSTSSSPSSPTFSVELNPGRADDEWSMTTSRMSTGSSEMVDDLGRTPYEISEVSKVESHKAAVRESKEKIGMNNELYAQLLEAMAEADNSRQDAFNEFIRRRKAEKDAIEAKCRVKALENLYADELRQRQEIDETLEKIKEDHENIKKELHMALEQKSYLESKISDFEHTIQELEDKISDFENHKRELDELQVKLDDALRLVEEMKAKQGETTTSSSVSHLYTEFDFSEVKDATCNFDPALKIGEGGYGSIFRGSLRHIEVAIKMLHSNSLQGPSEFQQEVSVLSKLRHPNLVTLIGACPDAWVIIYEYLSGGSLEDRLECKNNTPPLSWQSRIRIAAELCSVLIYLHSCGIVHGDLKPDNVLLDKNLVSKLSDFGICRVLSQKELSYNNTSMCHVTGPKGTLCYMDPEFLSTGELTTKSDTYSFGVILLRLLTGKSALGLTKEVKCAVNDNMLKNVLDPTAGDWPLMQAQELAALAMNCCNVVRKNRPDLAPEVFRVLKRMRVSCVLSY